MKRSLTEHPDHPQPKVHKEGHGRALMWFRNDLRCTDNPALHAASDFTGTTTGLLALFLVDLPAWRKHDMAGVRVDFVLRSVSALCRELNEYNIPLQVVKMTEEDRYEQVISRVCMELDAQAVFWNAEYEFDEGERDRRVCEYLLKEHGILSCIFHDQCAVKPGELKTKTSGKPFTVFTPFKKAWIAHLLSHPIELAPEPMKQRSGLFDELRLADVPGDVDCKIPDYTDIAAIRKEWPAGEHEAMDRLVKFSELISEYKTQRDIPSANKTSLLSGYLAVGAISARQCLKRAVDLNKGRFDGGSEGIAAWISELCWRDFYRHILVAFPRVSMSRPFKENTVHVPWRYLHDDDRAGGADFSKWCEGQTGYPLVDAAMRCLNRTGWMHNRLRMVTAMFLTKHLLIWWPRGEAYFMRHLIDGDLASNNGGWQWSASTGTDAQPYFRIFNPVSQSERFDPDAVFIKKWLPELRDLGAEYAHFPFGRMERRDFEKLGYPEPIVDHKEARERCLQAFSNSKL